MKPHYLHIKSFKVSIIVGFIAGLIIAFILIIFILDKPANAPLEPQNTIAKVEMPVENPKPSVPELPFGGRQLLPTYRFVALYGSPESKGLGSLGEQPINEAIQRAKTLTEQYQDFSTETIIPTFEIITTVASAGPTENDDYSQEISIEKIKPWVDQAREAKMYVILDLQPGRNTFLDQAKAYEPLLREPHVGLALDPEWRLLTPQARHLKSVGSVSADEVNQTSAWLAELTKNNNLPQKIFMIHQFKTSMITNRELLVTTAPELAYIIHVDGFGTYPAKQETWRRITENLPTNTSLGWKNFIDEDKPTPTPEQTMSQVPKPVFVSFQ